MPQKSWLLYLATISVLAIWPFITVTFSEDRDGVVAKGVADGDLMNETDLGQHNTSRNNKSTSSHQEPSSGVSILFKNPDFEYDVEGDDIIRNIIISNSADWWLPWVDRVAMPFPIVANKNATKSWCVPRKMVPRTNYHRRNGTFNGDSPGRRTNSNTYPDEKAGLYLVKVPKTASSTAAGVTIQIAEIHLLVHGNADDVLNDTDNREDIHRSSVGDGDQNSMPSTTGLECTYHVAHGWSYASRTEPSFLWTVLRNPTDRAISQYFFEFVSRKGTMATSIGMINYLKGSKNFQLDYVAKTMPSGKLRHSLKANSLTTAEDIVEILQKDVFGVYGFIGVTERMEESLVLLKIILGVPLKFFVVLSSKVRGGLDDGRFDNVCTRIVEPFTTPEVETYVRENYPLGNYDFFSYAAANRSLDLTIDAVGWERFQKALKLYQHARKVAEEHCLDHAIFPCVQEGKPPLPESQHSCFDGDIGCGYACVQGVLQRLGLGLH